MSKTDFVLMLSTNAYQEQKGYTALTFAIMALAKGMSVKIFLVENGVFMAKKNQNPDNFRSSEEWLQTFMESGGEVFLCQSAMAERGMTEDEVVEGVGFVKMGDAVLAAHDAVQAIFF